MFAVLPLIDADFNVKILYYCNENLMRIPSENDGKYKDYKLYSNENLGVKSA